MLGRHEFRRSPCCALVDHEDSQRNGFITRVMGCASNGVIGHRECPIPIRENLTFTFRRFRQISDERTRPAGGSICRLDDGSTVRPLHANKPLPRDVRCTSRCDSTQPTRRDAHLFQPRLSHIKRPHAGTRFGSLVRDVELYHPRTQDASRRMPMAVALKEAGGPGSGSDRRTPGRTRILVHTLSITATRRGGRGGQSWRHKHACRHHRAQEREAVLQRSEQELADFFDNAAMGLHWVGAGRYHPAGHQAELDLVGYKPGGISGRHIAEFHADQTVIADILARLHNHEVLLNCEARLRCKEAASRRS